MQTSFTKDPDVVLIGAGIMSSTLGVFLKERSHRSPSKCSKRSRIARSKAPKMEQWRRPCGKLRDDYTPERPDGSVDISERSRSMSNSICRASCGRISSGKARSRTRTFIHPVPHMSFVSGADNVSFLKRRFEAMSAHPAITERSIPTIDRRSPNGRRW